MAVTLFLSVRYLCIKFENRQKMNMSEFYSEFLFRYQTDDGYSSC